MISESYSSQFCAFPDEASSSSSTVQRADAIFRTYAIAVVVYSLDNYLQSLPVSGSFLKELTDIRPCNRPRKLQGVWLIFGKLRGTQTLSETNYSTIIFYHKTSTNSCCQYYFRPHPQCIVLCTVKFLFLASNGIEWECRNHIAIMKLSAWTALCYSWVINQDPMPYIRLLNTTHECIWFVEKHDLKSSSDSLLLWSNPEIQDVTVFEYYINCLSFASNVTGSHLLPSLWSSIPACKEVARHCCTERSTLPRHRDREW